MIIPASGVTLNPCHRIWRNSNSLFPIYCVRHFCSFKQKHRAQYRILVRRFIDMKAITTSGIFAAILASLPAISFGAANDRLTFEGLSLPAIGVEPPQNTGLDMVYVCYDTTDSSVKFPTSNPQTKWYRYSNLGGGYAEEITEGITYESGFSILQNPASDMGYIIEDTDRRAYFWIIGYKGKRLTLRKAEAAPEQDCDYSILDVEGEGEALHYFTINGQQRTLSRDIEVRYHTLTFDSDRLQYIQGETTQMFESLTPQLRVSPPALCQTDFIISGDRFLREWDWLEEISTGVVQPHAVAVRTSAEQEGLDSDGFSQGGSNGSDSDNGNSGSNDTSKEDAGSNIISTGGESGLGGSAPAEISFRAYVTDGVLHSEWQMATNPEFDPIDYRFNQQDLDYMFNDEGTFYLRFIGSNADGSCEAFGDEYMVTIGASELRIPNAFSPNGDGINDEWKVAYRSLTKFECWIFDRYGKEVCHLTSPDMGWDGKIGGREAKPGVYYYVIEATGADGKKYKKSGDINILKYVGGNRTQTTPE